MGFQRMFSNGVAGSPVRQMETVHYSGRVSADYWLPKVERVATLKLPTILSILTNALFFITVRKSPSGGSTVVSRDCQVMPH